MYYVLPLDNDGNILHMPMTYGTSMQGWLAVACAISQTLYYSTLLAASLSVLRASECFLECLEHETRSTQGWQNPTTMKGQLVAYFSNSAR